MYLRLYRRVQFDKAKSDLEPPRPRLAVGSAARFFEMSGRVPPRALLFYSRATIRLERVSRLSGRTEAGALLEAAGVRWETQEQVRRVLRMRVCDGQ